MAILREALFARGTMMSPLKNATATAIVALSAAFAAPDDAAAFSTPTVFTYGGGSSLASIVYRALMDTWDIPIDAPGPACGATAADISGANAMILFIDVGSGAGKQAFFNHNGTHLGLGGTNGPPPVFPSYPPPYWSGSVSCTNPFGIPPLGYPFYHFAAADDVITPADIATYNANSGPANWGKLNQIPAFVAPIVIAFNPAGMTLDPLGLSLTRKQVCGIFSGHVTDWADPIFAHSGENGRPLVTFSTAINVIHESDTDGATFLLSNALKTQCAGIVGPNNAFNGDNTPTLWEFNWTDRTIPASQCPALPVRGASAVNWPDVGGDQCGAPIARPGGSSFYGTLGLGQCLIGSVPGAIGYGSLAFTNYDPITCPGTPSGPNPSVARLQNQYGVDNDPPDGPYTFVAPNPAAARAAMASAVPVFPDDAALTNPLNWSTQGLVPNPTDPNAYPITGFSWLELYQCYNANVSFTGDDIAGTLESFLEFLYGGQNPGTAAGILNKNGFSTVPSAWSDQVANLLLNSSARLGVGGVGVCANIPGA